ncbi:MAG: hydantoinase/oxoprolinase family protein [Alphaproteobacteria bacterium]|nr:hydantoinase/oxoprolinase family protein [Alphaproteobacteria bacterium]
MTHHGKTARIGADIGGTFTDIVLELGSEIHSTKLLTTHAAPEQAIIEGIAQVAREAGISTDAIDSVIHGTTLATNALIEKRGARTAFITTKGFRDVVEMRTENRFELYDLNIVLPPPLIAREHRYVIDERIDASGRVLKHLDVTELEGLADRILRADYESVAVGLIHAYANDAHEHQIRDVLRRRRPALPISISSEVSPQMREFQRFNTVCANAYVQPVMASYLARLTDGLRGIGVMAPLYIMHSGGGIITVDSAIMFPVRLLESGPAGGAIFAADIAARHGLDRVLSYDMGGTTAKICLIEDATPKTAKTFEVARTYRFKKGSGMPISIPVIEMVEIGAGGGSIARIDSMRQIRVGPESAGSEPGPACYGLGGKDPTVTDADLVLGRIDADAFAGGTIHLSIEASEAALVEKIGATLGVDSVSSAFGLSEVVDENMSNAARMHAVENGKELSGFVMVAFGGAAPLHAARLGEKLGVTQIIVPPGAGVGSAIGFLKAPFAFESVRSAYVRLGLFDAGRVNQVIAELSNEAVSFVKAGTSDLEPHCELTAHMRYVGQGWEIPVAVEIKTYGDSGAAEFGRRFDEAYVAQFGRAIDGLDIEIVSWSLRASSPAAPVTKTEFIGPSGTAIIAGRRDIFEPDLGAFGSASIVARRAMRPGERIAGPAAIVEAETTTIVTRNYEAFMQSDGCLLLRAVQAPLARRN